MKFQNQARLLRSRRTEAGVTQVEIAKKLGITSQYIANMERGVAGIPANYAKRIARILGMSPVEFESAATEDFKDRYQEESKR